MPDACYYCYLDTKSTMIITIFIFYPVTQKYKRENVNVSVRKYLLLLFQRDCETDVWISKLWLFYVNRSVMILPRLKYFESPAAATIQASVCLPSSLSFRISDSTSENIFATWIYFCIHHKTWIMNGEPRSHILVSTAQAVNTEAQYLSPYIRVSLAEHRHQGG